MGRRGPTPTPTEILKRRGSREVSKRKNEPHPDRGARCPSWLDKDAKAVWQQVAKDLNALGVLTKVDANALARYCRLFVRWKKADAFLQQYGETYALKDDEGKPKCFQQFPEVGILNKLGPQLLRLEQEFGLTPAARARIQVEIDVPRVQDDKSRFFKVVA